LINLQLNSKDKAKVRDFVNTIISKSESRGKMKKVLDMGHSVTKFFGWQQPTVDPEVN